MLSLVLVLLPVACDGSSSTNSTRDLVQASSSPTPDSELIAAVRNYERCLADEGISASAARYKDGSISSWPSYELNDEARGIERACGRELNRLVAAPPPEVAAFLEDAEKFAVCMKEHGIDNIEVDPSGIHLGPGNPDRVIRRAERKCRYLMQGP